jgi:tetratricopeptide (TPR) repeat protein
MEQIPMASLPAASPSANQSITNIRPQSGYDQHGNPWSGADHAAAEIYSRAQRAFNNYRGDPVAIIDQALAANPQFVMAHLFRAHMHLALWERRAAAEVSKTLATLDESNYPMNEREQQHAAALKHWANGHWDEARSALDRLNADYPRDMLALQVGHLCDFFHGDRDNLRARVARALPHWSAADHGYSYLLGWHAFGLEESGQYALAEETGRHALELDANDCWAHHAVTHVMEMQGRQREGIAFMEAREGSWAQTDNEFQFHNWWHKALFHLDQGDVDAALAIYDKRICSEPCDLQMVMLDATALLWRMHLQRVDMKPRWLELGPLYSADDEAGFYAFNDMHAVMALVASDDHDAVNERVETARAIMATDSTAGFMLRGGAFSVLCGFAKFGRGDYVAAIEHLLPVRYRAHIFGGSHAQRDIIHRTLIEAAIRSNNKPLAMALTAERNALKPGCPFSRGLADRAHELV